MDFQGEGTVTLHHREQRRPTEVFHGGYKGKIAFDGPWVHIKQQDKGYFVTVPADDVQRIEWKETNQ